MRRKAQVIPEGTPDADNVGGFMAKPADDIPNGERTKRPSNVVYVLIGVRHGEGRQEIIGQQPTRGKCWRQWKAIEMLASAVYQSVYVVKGKRLATDDLYRNITRQRKAE